MCLHNAKRKLQRIYSRKMPEDWYPFPYLYLPPHSRMNPYDAPLAMVAMPLSEKNKSTNVDVKQLRVAHETSHALRDVVGLAHNRILENLVVPVFMDGALGYFDPEKCCLVSSGIFTRSLKLVIELNCLFPQLVADTACKLFEGMLKSGIYNDLTYPYKYISADEKRPLGRTPQTPAETRFLLRRCGGAGGGICGIGGGANKAVDMKMVRRLREKLKAGIYLESAAALLRMPSTRRTYERLSSFFEIRYFRVGFQGLIGRHLEMSEYPLGSVYDHDCGLNVHVSDRYLIFLRWIYAAACYDPDCLDLSMDSRVINLNRLIFGSDWSCYLTLRTMVEAYFHEIRLRRCESSLYRKFLQSTPGFSQAQHKSFVQELKLNNFLNTHPSYSQSQHPHSHFLDREATISRTEPTSSTESTITDQPITRNGELTEPSKVSRPKELGIVSSTTDLPEFDPQRPYSILQNIPQSDPDYRIIQTLCMLYDLPLTKNIQARHRSWISALSERHPTFDLQIVMTTLDVYVVHSRVTPDILHNYAQSLQESFSQLSPFLPKLLTELASIDEWLDIPPLANERHFQIAR